MADALAAAEGDTLRAMLRGVELMGTNQTLRAAASALRRRGAVGAAALCRLKAFRRISPTEEMATAFKSDLVDAQRDAVRAAVYSQSRETDVFITAVMRNQNTAVRLAAIETGLMRGLAPAREAMTQLARQLDEEAGPYLKLIAMFGTPADHEVVYRALRVPEVQLASIWALGHIGTARAAESCLAGMQYEHLARACGEAYSWITVADLERDGLAKTETPAEAPPFEEDDLDANLVPPPESLWPLPDVEAVCRHWSGLRTEWTADVRYVRGQPASVQRLAALIETGPMLRRPDLILELRARTRGSYDVEPRAFAARQRQMMAASRAGLAKADGN
jgi:uncharacterized protein (TIGR02270 family)